MTTPIKQPEEPPIDNTAEQKDNTDNHFDLNTPYKAFDYSEFWFLSQSNCF